jgi:glycosyltransferase involved in cell wall biosynthesis
MATSTLRVLALADHLGHPSGRVHGGTTYFVTVYPALVRAGVDLTVAFMSQPHPAARLLRDEGVEPIFLSSPKWDVRVYGRLLRLIDERRVGVLHLASFKSQFLGRLAARSRGLPSIVHLHDTVPLSLPVRLLQRFVRRENDLAVAVSSPVAELGRRDYGFTAAQTRVLHNAIDIDRFAEPRPLARARLLRELQLAEPVQLVGVIGRLAPMKGHRYLLAAMPRVLSACPHTKLLVCGVGELQEECVQQVRALGIERQVVFAGQRDDIPDILAALDAVAMPSVSGEGLPYAAIEAIASGKAIVAYPTSGIPEVVQHEQCGLLVEHGQIEPFADALVRLLTDDALRARLSAGARARAREFALDRHVTGLIDFYHGLVHQNEGARSPA